MPGLSLHRALLAAAVGIAVLFRAPSTAGAAAAAESAVITAVDSYEGLLDVAGKVDDEGTGVRFEREVILLLHQSGSCEADFARHGLEEYGMLDMDGVALVSADVGMVGQPFLEQFRLPSDPASIPCPTAVVIKQRSRVDKPKYMVIESASGSTDRIKMGVQRTQVKRVNIVNQAKAHVEVSQVLAGAEQPLLEGLAPGQEARHTVTRGTELVARLKGGKAELQRLRIVHDGQFVVRDSKCTTSDCVAAAYVQPPPMDDAEKAECDRNDAYRQQLNREQPASLPHFTEVGFKKVRAPDDVWDAAITFYKHNKNQPKQENWHRSNVYTNDREAPSYMMSFPPGPFQDNILDGLRPGLEEWSGIELVPTALYGIRAYTNGSWLAPHVDRTSTHVVSAIINVDQDVNKDWPLEIYDHAGTKHDILMQPRDMVLYESATCIHGRPSVFDGKYYANFFVHFKPKDPSKWVVEK